MAVNDIYDLNQQAMVQALAAVADAYANGDLLTVSQIDTTIQGLIGEFKSTTAPQEVALVGGVATVERRAKINVISIDSQGGTPSDDADTIAWSGTGGPIVGDMYIFVLKTQVHTVTFTEAGNFKVGKGSFTMQTNDSMIVFVVSTALNLVEIARYPNVDTADAAVSRSTAYVTTATDTLNIFTRIVDVLALSAETLAQGTIEITSATGGRVEAWVDEGAGAFMIGYYDWVFGDVDTDVVTGLTASINLGTRYTSTADVLSPVPQSFVEAPVGTGSAANAYSLYSVVTTGITTTDTTLGVVVLGVDGTETAADIATFVGMEDGPIYMRNAMTAAALTIIAGGNVTGTAPLVVAAGAHVTLLKVGSEISLPL